MYCPINTDLVCRPAAEHRSVFAEWRPESFSKPSLICDGTAPPDTDCRRNFGSTIPSQDVSPNVEPSIGYSESVQSVRAAVVAAKGQRQGSSDEREAAVHSFPVDSLL